MNSKTYKLPNGKKAVFEYDITGVGKITLECMDELMDMIADRPQGEWIESNLIKDGRIFICSNCNMAWVSKKRTMDGMNYCPNCGARMKGADDE